MALVSLLTFCGLRISEALNADIRHYGHDHGHGHKVTRKGGKTARVALAPPVIRALDDYLADRTTGPIFVARDGKSRYGYKIANEQIARLCRPAGLPRRGHPAQPPPLLCHRVLRLGAALQDALGHADRRTTRRCDRHPQPRRVGLP